MTPQSASDAEIVAMLPRRVAHAVSALLDCSREQSAPTAAEVCLYDSEALSPRSTAAALREAAARGFVVRVPPSYWIATNAAHELRGALEDRYLADTGLGDS